MALLGRQIGEHGLVCTGSVRLRHLPAPPEQFQDVQASRQGVHLIALASDWGKASGFIIGCVLFLRSFHGRIWRSKNDSIRVSASAIVSGREKPWLSPS